MERRLLTPGPFRATKLWNEVTKYFRAGMPRRKHRQHFKKYGNCFTAAEATDWLHELLKNNNNFGLEVTREQTVQLLRKFLKNHVIEDIKGRWGSENLEDNNNLYRFPSTSPVRSPPSRCPLREKKNIPKESDSALKVPHFFRITPKKNEQLEIVENLNSDAVQEHTDKMAHSKRISQADIEEIWRSTILIHLQTILGVPSLEEVLDPAQIFPKHIIYNMTNTSKRGVVVLQDKSEDLPHWVLSAMKCLANWPRSNDMSQPIYVGFEQDVFKTVADYFLSLPEPLLTFEYYELFVNILVLCGYITIPNRSCGNPSSWNGLQLPKTPHLNSFRSTECLLLSLLHRVTDKKDETSGTVSKKMDRVERSCGAKFQQYNTARKRGSLHELMDDSYQNLSRLKNEEALPLKSKAKYCSLEGITDTTATMLSKDGLKMLSQPEVHITPVTKNENQLLHSQYKPDSLMNLCSSNTNQKQSGGVKRVFASGVTEQKLHSGNCKSKQLGRSQSLRENKSNRCSISDPVAKITSSKPHPVNHKNQSTAKLLAKTGSEPECSDVVISKRLCKSSTELSENLFSPDTFMLTGTSSLLQPHLERVAIEALQVCCLLLSPPNRRKLQLLMRMISRMSENVDMPRLHDAVGTRSLMIQTFSRCVLCCAEEVDLDELLATRLVSFLMDHHQDIFQVPTYLQVAVQDHIETLKTTQKKCFGEDLSAIFPTYSYCKRITTQEFDEQKVYTSQAAVAELLESIIKDRTLSIKDKKKKLKQFQKAYPQIYQKRFPLTESEAILFEDKPTIKQPMLILQKPKFCNLRH
ncbi:DEP domain-containing protein 1A isoform X2 [Heteronotia binoei]|uniref:DEP domain-containing protein 1A isoform X2 n=1 Tax=Heteronotia binoei TaxID=13085 RepID=UPI0029316DE2|nr:DEP domain-containing protein 1A isoform X2 [Heteronotia binoei]